MVSSVLYGQQPNKTSGGTEADYHQKYGFPTINHSLANSMVKTGMESAVSVASNTNSYCVPNSSSSCAGAYISLVKIIGTSLNNPSACNNTTTAYTEFNPATLNLTANLIQGNNYTLQVGVGAAGQVVSLWIDYNQDNIFAPNEWTNVAQTSNSGDTLNVGITIPITALAGPTGMRIRSRLNGYQNDSTSACTQFASGEAEDYTINIMPITGIYVTSFSPVAGSSGDTIKVYGYNFNNITKVKFNGVSAQFTPGTGNLLTAIVPLGATTGPISVISANDSAKSHFNFHIGAFHFDSISPAAARPGYPILIFCSDGLPGIIPKIDGIDFDSVRFDTNLKAYKALVPGGVSNGLITLRSGRIIDTAPKKLSIVQGNYCVPRNPFCFPGNANITKVSIDNTTLNNHSACNNGLYFNSVVFGPSGNKTADLTMGQTYQLNVTTSATGAHVSAWIDFNGDNRYHASEYYLITSYSTANTPSSVSIIVPYQAINGAIGLRIRTNTGFGTISDSSACFTYNNGETEDYLITLNEPTNMLLTACGSMGGLPGDSVNLKGYHLDRATGITFNGVYATFSPLLGPNSIIAYVPVGATTGPICVFNSTDTTCSCSNFRIGGYKIDSIVPAAARAGYPVLIYSPDGRDSLKPKIDGITFDNITWVPGYKVYKAMLPVGATSGLVTLGTGRLAGQAPNNLIILPWQFCPPKSYACSARPGTDNITNVSIDQTSLYNNSDCENLLYYNFIAYPAIGNKTATLIKGHTYNLNVTTNTANIIAIWFDWNADGFYSGNEWGQVTTRSRQGIPNSYSFTVPANATVGQVSIRIRTRSAGNPNDSSNVCSEFYSGEAEEYIVTVQNPTGVMEPGHNCNIIITPNPNNGQFALNLEKGGVMSVYDALGRQVFTQVLKDIDSATEAKFEINNLPSGVYLLEIITAHERKIERMIISSK